MSRVNHEDRTLPLYRVSCLLSSLYIRLFPQPTLILYHLWERLSNAGIRKSCQVAHSHFSYHPCAQLMGRILPRARVITNSSSSLLTVKKSGEGFSPSPKGDALYATPPLIYPPVSPPPV